MSRFRRQSPPDPRHRNCFANALRFTECWPESSPLGIRKLTTPRIRFRYPTANTLFRYAGAEERANPSPTNSWGRATPAPSPRPSAEPRGSALECRQASWVNRNPWAQIIPWANLTLTGESIPRPGGTAPMSHNEFIMRTLGLSNAHPRCLQAEKSGSGCRHTFRPSGNPSGCDKTSFAALGRRPRGRGSDRKPTVGYCDEKNQSALHPVSSTPKPMRYSRYCKVRLALRSHQRQPHLTNRLSHKARGEFPQSPTPLCRASCFRLSLRQAPRQSSASSAAFTPHPAPGEDAHA